METTEQNNNIKKLDVTFLRPTFKTSRTGRVQAIIKMEPVNPDNKNILGRNDALMFDSTNEFFTKRLGPFSEFKISYNIETGFTEINEMNREGQPVTKPTHCNSCNRPLNLHNQDKEIYCNNPSCPAQSLTCVRAIVYSRLQADLKPKLNSFLRNYLVAGDKFNIDNLFEFREAFFRMNNFPKNTPTRKAQWLEANGKVGNIYHEIELTYASALNRREIPRQEFWEVCSFPYENRGFGSQIPQDFKLPNGRFINPEDVVSGKCKETSEYILNKMSKWSQGLLATNEQFIKLLFETYTTNGPVKWI